MTERARQEACRLVGEDGLDVAAVATTLGVGWHTVMRAVRDYGEPLRDDPARTDGVVAVGVDRDGVPRRQRRLTHPVRHRHRGDARPGTGTGAAARRRPRTVGRCCFAVDDGAGSGLASAGHDCLTLDPFRGYATALRTSLPDAVRVLDALHVVRLGQAAVDDVRRRRQQETLGRRGTVRTRSTAAGGCCAEASRRSTSGTGPASS